MRVRLTERVWVEKIVHNLYFNNYDKHGRFTSGHVFPCDAEGNVDESRLTDIAKKYLNNYRENGRKGDVRKQDEGYWEPATMRCDCGRIVSLGSSWANSCECGAEYNGSGQRLAPRSQWGEETGESYD